MITKEKIKNLVEEILSDDMFIVGINVGSGNAIAVLVDSDSGISIDECAGISHYLEQKLDRRIEDFWLEVSSPGLTQPLKVLRQYIKNIGRRIEVMTIHGEKQEGILKSVNKNGFEMETIGNKQVNGNETQILGSLEYPFEQIKTVKLVISFK